MVDGQKICRQPGCKDLWHRYSVIAPGAELLPYEIAHSNGSIQVDVVFFQARRNIFDGFRLYLPGELHGLCMPNQVVESH